MLGQLLRGKNPLLWACVLVAVVALGVFYGATSAVINPAFDKIEHQRVLENASRAADALSSKVDLLEFKVTDWASWDDTYLFVENHNAAFIKSNLQNNSLQNLGLNVMLFYNEHQQLVTKKAIDVDSGNEVAVPDSLLAAFKPGSKLLATDVDSSHKGILTLPDRTVQFVAAPILTSDGTGPLHGTLVFATYLSASEVANISSVTHEKVSYWRLNDSSAPVDVKSAVGQPTKPLTAIKTASAKTIYGYQTINDVLGKPALVARVEQPRDIHEVAQTALTEYLLIIVLDTLGAIVFIGILVSVIGQKDRTIKLKNEFFSIASHELRTPLTVIRNYAQLMKFQFSNQIKDPKFDHMADSIDQAGAQLIGVVNVYLDAARLESGKIPFQSQPFSISELAISLAPQLKATAKTKNVSVGIECPPELPLVMADKERVQQVILNLFGNALKFTDNGSITIKAEADGKMMHVYVTDTGRGMDISQQKQLFQRFKQTEAKDALRGSGLGLFISKKLIEQMGGTIKVASSAPGIGTTLGFTLPLNGVSQPKAASTPSQASPSSLPLPSATPPPIAPPLQTLLPPTDSGPTDLQPTILPPTDPTPPTTPA